MRNLLTPKDVYTIDYPEAIEFTEQQQAIYWPYFEVKVEKDVQSILVDLTEAEKHGTLSTLKLFTQYELIIGNEYWQHVSEMFRHPADIGRMAATFSFFELGIHAPFYSQINEALGLATEEFYSEWKTDPILANRIAMLEQYANTDKPAEFLMALAFAEGVILYSSFAFLKHFQSEGKNKISNIVRGINFSARDEGLHSEASAWLFRTLLQEQGWKHESFQEKLEDMASLVRDHEYAIVDMIFSKGKIDGITDVQMKHFVDSRINLVCRNLGFKNLYEVSYNPIASWFYNGLNAYQYNDFFAGQGNQYERGWTEDEFSW